MYCINLKKKKNKPFCKIRNKEINLSDCAICKCKEYKKREKKEKKKSTYTKTKKLERNRFSIITSDLNHCIICRKTNINKHEIFFGTGKRILSMKYGLVIPLCQDYHHNQYNCTGIHFDKELCLKWQKKGQLKAMEYYNWTTDEFIKIFGKNYLD